MYCSDGTVVFDIIYGSREAPYILIKRLLIEYIMFNCNWKWPIVKLLKIVKPCVIF